MYSAACGERLRQLDMKYPKDSKFLSKIKLRVADKFKRDIDDIVEEVVQVNTIHGDWKQTTAAFQRYVESSNRT